MITPQHAQLMAKYNRWQNQSLYGAADTLTDAQRKENRGAFFGSIHGTLNHLLWADQIWMHRFAGTPKPQAGTIPESIASFESWDDLKRAREAFDAAIIDWTGKLDPKWLDGDLTWYSGVAKRDITKPKWILLTHMFNHQTHHRGQVHCMLTQAGVKPEPTDLAFMGNA